VATGIIDLDELTQGQRPGHVWVLTGPPFSGKSVLAAQLAAHVALQDDLTTVLAVLRDPPQLTWDRLVSATSGLPLPGPAWQGPTPSEDAQDRRARELAEDRLRLCRPWLAHDESEVLLGRWVNDGVLAAARLLVVDDLHLVHGKVRPEWLVAWARAHRATVVLTTVPEAVYTTHPYAPRGAWLQPRWRDHADMVAELRWPTPQERSAPIKLSVLRHRWGPCCRHRPGVCRLACLLCRHCSVSTNRAEPARSAAQELTASPHGLLRSQAPILSLHPGDNVENADSGNRVVQARLLLET